MTQIEALSYALALALLSLAYFGWWGKECRCDKCAYHVNERRMAALRQAELRHDLAHKGFGWKEGDPDLFPCNQAGCDRNPKE